MATIFVVEKAVAEKFEIGLRYWPPDIRVGQTITAVEISVVPTGLGLDGDPTIDGLEVKQMVYGGMAGVRYVVQFKITTSIGYIFENPQYDAITVRVV
jgi:hypothetical protein